MSIKFLSSAVCSIGFIATRFGVFGRRQIILHDYTDDCNMLVAFDNFKHNDNYTRLFYDQVQYDKIRYRYGQSKEVTKCVICDIRPIDIDHITPLGFLFEHKSKNIQLPEMSLTNCKKI
jgi:hypothetical protein